MNGPRVGSPPHEVAGTLDASPASHDGAAARRCGGTVTPRAWQSLTVQTDQPGAVRAGRGPHRDIQRIQVVRCSRGERAGSGEYSVGVAAVAN
jgi:hypothetical protein